MSWQLRPSRSHAYTIASRHRRLLSFLAALLLLFIPLAGSAAGPATATAPASRDPRPHPILSDVRVRRAIAHCTNKDALVASVYPQLTPAERQSLIMDTFIAPFNWAYTAPDVQYDYNPAAGAALLEEAGWVLGAGQQYRRKEPLGELTLSLTATESGFRQTFLAVFEAQLQACGIRLIRIHARADWFFGDVTGLAVRDFETTDFAWVGQENPTGTSLYACDRIPLPSNGWAGQNFMGWCNPVASDAVEKADNAALSQAERKGYYETVIDELAKDVPTLPLFMRWPIDEASYTWEHIDFNLQTFSESIAVQPQVAASGQFTDFDGDTTVVSLPAGAASSVATMTYAPLLEGQGAPPGPTALKALRLTASVDGVPASASVFNYPATIEVSYTDAEVDSRHLPESSLKLYAAIDGTWQDATYSCPEALRHSELDTQLNRVVANVCTLGEFTVRGVWRNSISLPAVMR